MLISSVTLAGAIPCTGKVSAVLADHPTCGEANIAFITSATNGKFVCTKTTPAVSTVLSAAAMQKDLKVVFTDTVASNCDSIPEYSTVSYMVLYPQ